MFFRIVLIFLEGRNSLVQILVYAIRFVEPKCVTLMRNFSVLAAAVKKAIRDNKLMFGLDL